MKRGSPPPRWLYVTLLLLFVLLVAALWLLMQPEHPRQTHPQHSLGVDSPAPVFEDFSYVPPAPVVEAIVEPKVTPPAEAQNGLALVLDDVGYDLPALRRLLKLPFPVAISVLPDAPSAREAAELAHAHGNVVMLHLPMEPANPHYRAKMDNSFLRGCMDEQTIRAKFESALKQVPYAVGVNNHMGSFLTAQPDAMNWVMDECRKQGLFFLDSKTSGKSVAADIAAEHGLVWGERRVFLDNTTNLEDMQRAWRAGMRCARQKGGCIMIAHPHAETLDFLEHQVPKSDYGHMRRVTTLLHAATPEKAG
jgi:hypothetical protein